MIRTKPAYRSNMPSNVSTGIPLGWQKPSEFYSPKYEIPTVSRKKSGDEDNRLTVYWNPDLRPDAQGEVEFTFYTTDGSSDYRVVLEGMIGPREYHTVVQTIRKKK